MRSCFKKPIVCVVLFSLIFLVSIFIIKNSRSGGGPVGLFSAPLIEPLSLQFPDTPVGSGLVNPQIIYIKNIGDPTSQLFVWGAYLDPSPGTDLKSDLIDFLIDYRDCLGRGIFPDQPCAVHVYFTPKSEGEKKQVVTVDVRDPFGGPYGNSVFNKQITFMGKGISGPANIPTPEPAPFSPPPPAPVVQEPAPFSPPPPAPAYSEEEVEANQVRGGCALQTIVGFNWVSILFPLGFIVSLGWIRARRVKN